MVDKLAGILLLILFSAYFINNKEYKKQKIEIKKISERYPLNATFVPKEITEDPNDSCIHFQGSSRSFDNPKNYNSDTKFSIIKVTSPGEEDCILTIEADGEIFLEPSESEGLCLNFKKPKPYLTGNGDKTMVRVADHCL